MKAVMAAWAAVNVALFWPNPWMVALNAWAVGVLMTLGAREATR